MVRKKKKLEEEHENTERWLVSYADFITLLFAFFVTMYSMSRVDGNKLGSAVESLQRALGSVIAVKMSRVEAGVFPDNQSPTAFNTNPIQAGTGSMEKEAFEKLAKKIKSEVDTLSKKETDGMNLNNMKFLVEKRGLIIRVQEHLFFKSGDASILPEFTLILNVLGKVLAEVPNHIRIEGHTDSVPINTIKFPSNWELSTARATNVLRYLVTHYNFKPEYLSATGYGEFRPIDSNQTYEGRFQNRRVDFVILSSKEMESEPQKERNIDQKESI